MSRPRRSEVGPPRSRWSSPASSSGATSAGESWPAVPELPETETIARDLNGAIVRAQIESLRIVHPDVLREVTPRQLAKRVTGATITRCWRRAKLVVLDLSTGD